MPVIKGDELPACLVREHLEGTPSVPRCTRSRKLTQTTRGMGWGPVGKMSLTGRSVLYKKERCAQVARLATVPARPRAASPLARLSEASQVFQPALEAQSHETQGCRVSGPPRPHGRTPDPAPVKLLASGPPGPQGGAREAAAKGLRLPRPARAPQGPRSRLAAAAFCAPRRERQLRQSWTQPLSFSSTTSAGKRKRKPPGGGTGAERGPAARGGGPGLGSARGLPGGVRGGARSRRVPESESAAHTLPQRDPGPDWTGGWAGPR
ncbi:hypothetical protein H8959_000096 [Pygathrix nigripes]